MEPTVAVVGGGPAGCVCASELARMGHPVLLVDSGTPRGSRLGQSCSPRARWLLERCGLEFPVGAHRALAAYRSAWGSDEPEGRSTSFWSAADGLVLDRPTFDEWLRARAEACGVTVLRGHRVLRAEYDGPEWRFDAVRNGESRRCRAGFVVEATGRTLRSAFQPDVHRHFMDRLVCVSTEIPEEGTGPVVAMVESCEVGWWYTVPLPGGRRTLALFTDSDVVESPVRRSRWFKGVLETTRHLRHFAPQVPDAAALQLCDCRTSIRTVLWRGSWMALGDAAWSLDPLSGRGVERAVEDAVEAAAAISSRIGGGGERLRSFATAAADAFRRALHVQREYYAIESRWKDHEFWRRRA